MALTARIMPDAAFDARQMERYWTLESDFLAGFADDHWGWEIRRKRSLLSAVMFGGLLDRNSLQGMREVFGSPLPSLAPDGRLKEDYARSTILKEPDRCWFADPLTRDLLRRRVPWPINGRPAEGGASEPSDYARLLRLDDRAFIDEVGGWVMAAATTKARLFWPSLVVNHCTGALQSVSLPLKRWESLERGDVPFESSSDKSLLERIRTVRPRSKASRKSYPLFKDKGFHFIRVAIAAAIKEYERSDDPTLASERKNLTLGLKENQDLYSQKFTLRWWINEWFIQYCPKIPLRKGQRPTPRRAKTLQDHAFALGGSVDWSDLWFTPLETIDRQAIVGKLHSALKTRPDALALARRLYAFLGYGSLPQPEGLPDLPQGSGVKREILSGPEFKAVLSDLHDQSGGRGAHWLAAMLMFRCGLRPQEIIALEIDQVSIVGEIVELKVAATPYVNLKNRTSRRTLPLHALLSDDELAELLHWRALRIRDCKGNREHARLFFATIYHSSDYNYLLDPIEITIRHALGRELPTDKERQKQSYVFARCSILRHSFVCYAVATMLFPRDDGGFEMPRGVSPDLISLERRERLERALLSEGHLGLSSLEAVRQMTGHARYQRTISTYTHLMDLVAGIYAWRRSCEPSLPSSELHTVSPPAALKRSTELPEWRRDEIEDWRTADQIVQMASRGIPARLIADEVGVRLVHVERLARRYHQLLSLERRATARGNGKLRHAILLESPDARSAVFDDEVTCWYSPLKRLRSMQHVQADAVWGSIEVWRKQPAVLAKIREYLGKHQNGRPAGKPHKPLELICEASSGTASETFASLSAVTLLHLLLLAEAASQDELPAELIATLAPAEPVNFGGSIAECHEPRARKKRATAGKKRKAQAEAETKKTKRPRLGITLQKRDAGERGHEFVAMDPAATIDSPQAKLARRIKARKARYAYT